MEPGNGWCDGWVGLLHAVRGSEVVQLWMWVKGACTDVSHHHMSLIDEAWVCCVRGVIDWRKLLAERVANIIRRRFNSSCVCEVRTQLLKQVGDPPRPRKLRSLLYHSWPGASGIAGLRSCGMWIGRIGTTVAVYRSSGWMDGTVFP